MTKKQSLIFLIVLFVMVAALALGSMLISGTSEKSYNVSVIMHGKSDESMNNMRYGMEQAASYYNIELSFVTLSENYDDEEQAKLISREVANGADALVVSPAGDKSVQRLKSVVQQIPVISLESTVNAVDNIPSVCCDNYKIGQKLAENMISRGWRSKKIAVITCKNTVTSVGQRIDGFKDTIVKSGNTVSEISCNDDDAVSQAVKTFLISKGTDAVVAFNSQALYNCTLANRELSREYKAQIFGLFGGNKIIPMLESGEITAAAVQNEYNMGYLAVSGAADRLHGKKIADTDIDFSIVDRINMYSERNQRLLFPIII